MNPKAFDDSTMQTIRQQYQNGVSTYTLADEYFCCRQTIWECVKDIKDRNKNLHKRKYTDKRLEQVKQAIKLGTRCTELAMILGVHAKTIGRWSKM